MDFIGLILMKTFLLLAFCEAIIRERVREEQENV